MRRESLAVVTTTLVLALGAACGSTEGADPAPADPTPRAGVEDASGPQAADATPGSDAAPDGGAGGRVPVGRGLGNASLAAGDFSALPLLSQTGVFTDLATLTPHPSLVPYAPNTELWSDDAIKTRWVAVPSDGAPHTDAERVTFSASGVWTFPIGTVTVKHFELVLDETTGARKRLETRVGVLQANGAFKGASYRWRSDGSDADIVVTTVDEVNTVTAGGSQVSRTHTYPGQATCATCHLPSAGFALALRTAQLNGDFAYPGGVTENQLRAWGRAGMFTAPFAESDVATYPRTVPVTDGTASLEARARSYFEANCSSCHHPGGANQAWDARFSTPLDQQNLLGGVVKPGDLAGSKLYQRMSYAKVDTPANANQMMPPLAKNHVDTTALGVVEQWILGL